MMPLYRFTLWFLSTACLPLAAAPRTLERAVATALERNPDARSARARAEAAYAVVEQAASAWLPRCVLSGADTNTNSPMMALGAILDHRVVNFGLDFNRTGHIDNLNVTDTVSYNLYSGGKAAAGRDAARAAASAADLDTQAALDRPSAELVGVESRMVEARLCCTVAAADQRIALVDLRHALGFRSLP